MTAMLPSWAVPDALNPSAWPSSMRPFKVISTIDFPRPLTGVIQGWKPREYDRASGSRVVDPYLWSISCNRG